MSNTILLPNDSIESDHSITDKQVLIKVEGVSKKFCRSLKKSLWYGVRDIIHELNLRGRNELSNQQNIFSANLRDDEFWAVNDVSFEVRRGECLGLIGHNGAGKTTLLKMLNGLIKPDCGRIEMQGKVGAMIALGAGFNPILTGRENVYVNASILGLAKREIDKKLPEIIDFAEIGEFIDVPVQSYSSGMQVRLGFAVATAIQPDILILDEVLAVGDTKFRQKSLNRIRSLLKRCAVIFVSHSEQDVRKIATDALLLSRGKQMHLGCLHEAYTKYGTERNPKKPISHASEAYENGISINQVQCFPNKIIPGNPLTLKIEIDSRQHEAGCALRLVIMECDGNRIAEWNSHFHQRSFDFAPGPQLIELEIKRIMLIPGRYTFALEIVDSAAHVKFKCLTAGEFNVAASGSPKVQCAVQF
jgi:lipopolysaccharide transport system ATP-binding protein